MYILGDIGNTETKVFLVSSNKRIIKKIIFKSKSINEIKLNKLFIYFNIDYKKIKKILFCSVVPKSFNIIKKFIHKKPKLNVMKLRVLI